MNPAALTPVEFASLLGVTDKTVRNWLNDNGLPSVKGNRGRLIESVAGLRWWHEYQNAQDGKLRKSASSQPVGTSSEPTETYEQSLARKTRADADLQELKLAKARGEVVALPDLERVLAASTKATQTQVLAVPSRLAPQMLGIEDIGQAVGILTAEMTQLLSNLATVDAVKEASGLEGEE